MEGEPAPDSLEAVRRRPGMFVGNTHDGSGLLHLIWEPVANAIDLHLARAATELHVAIDGSWITVGDDGPGIPVDVLEVVFTRRHTAPTYDGHLPHIHVANGVGGVGLAPVNALCARLEVETTHDGIRWAQAYVRGRPCAAVRRLGPSDEPGTRVRFQPDPEIFASIAPDAAAAGERLAQLAWLNPLLRITFQGARLPGLGGVASWVRRIAPVTTTYATSAWVDDVFVDLALGWTETDDDAIVRSFVNMHESRRGTHLEGLWRGLGAWGLALGARSASETGDALRPGLVAIVHVGLLAPRFGNPTREHLVSPVAADAVCAALERDVELRLKNDPRLRDHLRARLRLG